MRKGTLFIFIAVCCFTANAQLTLRPQVGVENPNTNIRYNNLSSFSPSCQHFAQMGLHADYQFKAGLAPFIGVFTHRPLVEYSFDNPETGMTYYSTTNGTMQLQLQAGLQYNTRPLALSKKTSSSANNTSAIRSGGCRGKSDFQKPQKMWTVRLQPSAGLAYMPSSRSNLMINNSGTQPSYTYNAGNNKTEFIAGLGFEFARNKTKFLTLSVNYFKGLGRNETIFSSQSSAKTVTTTLNSTVSGWNAALGIPITFTKNVKKASASNTPKTYYKCRRTCGNYSRMQ